MVGNQVFLVVELVNNVEDGNSGDYKLKVKIKKDNLKGENDITKEIRVNNVFTEDAELSLFNPESGEVEDSSVSVEQETVQNSIILKPSEIVYESSNVKIKKMVVYFLVASITLLVVFLVFKKV